MAKLSDTQKEALEHLYDGSELRAGLRTLEALEARGFIEMNYPDIELTSFGVNVVRMMRGELRRGRRR